MKRLEIFNAYKSGISTEQEFRELALTVASSKHVRVETPVPGTMTIVYRHTPGWAALLGTVCLALFLLGLLLVGVGSLVFLLGMLLWLAKTEDRVTVMGTDVDGGSQYTVQGVAMPKLAEFLGQEFRIAQ